MSLFIYFRLELKAIYYGRWFTLFCVNFSKAWVGCGIWIKQQSPSATPEHKILPVVCVFIHWVSEAMLVNIRATFLRDLRMCVCHCACADPPTLWHFAQWRFFLEHADDFADIWFSCSLDKYQLVLQYCNITVQTVWPGNTAKTRLKHLLAIAITRFWSNRPLPSSLLAI